MMWTSSSCSAAGQLWLVQVRCSRQKVPLHFLHLKGRKSLCTTRFLVRQVREATRRLSRAWCAKQHLCAVRHTAVAAHPHQVGLVSHLSGD